MKPVDALAAPAREIKTETAAIGMSAEQVVEIKAALQAQQKFVAEVLEHAARWELEGSELRICFRPDKCTFAGLMEGRETLEKIRGISSKVLGRPVRVCARLESGGAKEENSSRTASHGGMSTLQRQVNSVAVEASAGGGMVTVKMNGQKQVLEVKIEKEVFAGKDHEMLQDLVRAAVNEASRRVDEELANQMKSMAGGLPGLQGLKIPGLF
jgi:DNA-binding YbaB/EbfC family protein